MNVPAPCPTQEANERSAALARYGILDTPPEPGFDDIVLLAARMCDAPVALVSLVTDNRQWFKARLGFAPCQTPLSQSVCAHALREDSILVIGDLTRDDRTRDNTLVTDDPFIRFYAGAVIKTPEGQPIGTLCVIDTVARPDGLTATQAETLQALARQVLTQMELRRLIQEREDALRDATEADQLFKHQQRMLRDERQHRLKNVVAMVQSIVHRTLRHSATIDDARDAVGKRLRALAKGQEAVFAETLDQTDIAAIVRSTAELYQTEDHVFIMAGPDIKVGAKAALALSLIFNELATNAMKYGALSTDRGRVTVEWHLGRDLGVLLLELSWRESGGPGIDPPTRQGFGSTLIRQALSGSRTELRYLSHGLEYDLTVPLDRLT